MPELISVLIPAYNAERWLAMTVRSALDQTWPLVEVIVVDDGSTDRTLAVAKSLVTQQNQGAPAARNRALELAQGTYIQWLDADDLLHPQKIASQMRVAHESGDRRILLSCPFGTFFYRPEKAVFTPTSLWRDLSPLEYLLVRFNENACFQTDAWLVSRELTEAAGPWTDLGSPDDDGEYFCRVALQSARITFVPGARTYYRVGDAGTLSRLRSEQAVRALYQSKARCIGHLLSFEDSPRSREACLRLLQDWMADLYGHPDIVRDACALAEQLGGSLYRPPLSWKYRPIQALGGYDAAVRARMVLRGIYARTERKIDQICYHLTSREVDA
jgi:glycosyltransferase involved in cell wall biosynthesis